MMAICVIQCTFSQTEYRKGYVINNANDTIFGLVDYREGDKAHRSCDFKRSKDQSAVTYEPNDIIGYGFQNDKFFQSREISTKDQISRAVFLEAIVKGLVSLYKFEGSYFVEKESNRLYELSNELEEAFIDGKNVLKNTNKHIGILNMLLFDCAELRPKIQRVGLNQKVLTNLIEEYNQCKGEASITFQAKKPWTKAVIGIAGGLNISKLQFDDLSEAFEVSKSPIVGISLDVLSPRLSERISFHSDILFSTSRYYNFILFSNGSYTARNYLTVELQQLKIPIGIRYTFPQRNFTPYFNVGLSSTIHLNSSSSLVQEIESNQVVNTYESDAFDIKGNQLGLWGGFGMLKSINSKLNAFVELRYEQTDGITQYSLDHQAGLTSQITNFQVLIGVRLN